MTTINPEGAKITLDDMIDSVLLQMDSKTADANEFVIMCDQLEKLYKMKASERGNRVSADTVVTVAANLVGILTILKFERLDIITSKALNFLPKIK